ncbi:methyltransferase domain-containing protein [Paraburkholderia strydomiana]|uniref:methyltransferase domain-containing protein n=1 Tax=Paraburkholderia strydomiana TaxID=1245417 RepID=UPI002865BD30|nr:methyltransferase domain-containing protein [Paraburkholderia strydomiana]MDR7008899.1 ubiquinone/menaquinone biosynthesis C-methylase UbiE [Paraburkholderia strydomiana]
MVSQKQLKGPDVFGRTFAADEKSLLAIASRLEARAKHRFFQKVVDEYVNALELKGHESVLDLGCGTGAIARMIASRDDCKERITAIDISPYLVETGKRLASEEGLSHKIDFLTGDAHSIIELQGQFDVLIMHTLVSHVVDPVTVLQEARRLLRPGGRLVIFDGDFDSLTYATDAPDGGAETDRLQAIAGHTQGRVMRLMPRLLSDQGFSLEWSRAYVAADIGRADFWSSTLPALRVLLPSSGVMSELEASEYVDKLESASSSNTFFASCNFYTMIARGTIWD